MNDIIHIISAGHSGSTLLDLSIGSHKDFFSTGECTYFTWQLLRTDIEESTKSNGNICTCSSKFTECNFWQRVVSKIKTKKDIEEINEQTFPIILFMKEEYRRITPLYFRIKRLLFKYLIKFRLNNLALLITLNERRKIRNIGVLYDSIFESSDAKFIIDSSKDILRFWLLKKLDKKHNHHAIVLVRNPKGIAYSEIRRYKDKAKPISIVKGWCRKYNMTTFFLKNLHVKPQILSYEKFCKNPEQELNRIYLNLNQPTIDKVVINSSERHLIAGNPIRYNKEIQIRVDEEWISKLNPEMNDSINRILKSQLKSDLIKSLYNFK